MKKEMFFLSRVWFFVALAFILGAFLPAQAQMSAPKYEVDPSWPKPLPDT